MTWTADPAAIRAALDERARLRALPHYGGNNIPNSYLDRFNAETGAWLKRIGARVDSEPVFEHVPETVAAFLRDI